MNNESKVNTQEMLQEVLDLVAEKFDQDLSTLVSLLTFNFDFKSTRALGRCKLKHGNAYQIDINFLLQSDVKEMRDTLIHEVAHAIVAMQNTVRVKPHGREWKAVMRKLGGNPSATAATGLLNEYRLAKAKYVVKCGCTEHSVGKKRYEKVKGGYTGLKCNKCGESVVAV